MQAKLNLMKLKPGFGAFYVIRLGNGSDLFYVSQGPDGAGSDDTV